MNRNVKLIILSVVALLVVVGGSIFGVHSFNKNKFEKSYETMSIFSSKYNQPNSSDKVDSSNFPIVEFYVNGYDKDNKTKVNLIEKANTKNDTIIYNVINLTNKKDKPLAATSRIKSNTVRVLHDNTVIFEKTNPSEKDIKKALSDAEKLTK